MKGANLLNILQKSSSFLQVIVYSLGEREKLHTAFCNYQSSQNKHDDSDPNHWDIALDLSGLDFYAAASGSHVTMGLAHVAGKTSFGLISA